MKLLKALNKPYHTRISLLQLLKIETTAHGCVGMAHSSPWRKMKFLGNKKVPYGTNEIQKKKLAQEVRKIPWGKRQLPQGAMNFPLGTTKIP
jgi:hypothetical protein